MSRAQPASRFLPLRLRLAWACLRGRPVGYRLDFTRNDDGTVTIGLRGGNGFMAQCNFTGAQP